MLGFRRPSHINFIVRISEHQQWYVCIQLLSYHSTSYLCRPPSHDSIMRTYIPNFIYEGKYIAMIILLCVNYANLHVLLWLHILCTYCLAGKFGRENMLLLFSSV